MVGAMVVQTGVRRAQNAVSFFIIIVLEFIFPSDRASFYGTLEYSTCISKQRPFSSCSLAIVFLKRSFTRCLFFYNTKVRNEL